MSSVAPLRQRDLELYVIINKATWLDTLALRWDAAMTRLLSVVGADPYMPTHPYLLIPMYPASTQSELSPVLKIQRNGTRDARTMVERQRLPVLYHQSRSGTGSGPGTGTGQ